MDVKLWFILLMLVSVFIASVSQVLLKKEALRDHDQIAAEYLNWRVILAYFLFLLTSFLTLFAYKYVPLSLGAILEATSYIYVAAFGVFIFKETWGIKKTIGTILILSGIVIYVLVG